MIPLTLNPLPLAPTLVMSAVTVPEFVMVTLCCVVLPTAMFPNEMLLGVAVTAALLAFAPFPLRPTLVGEFFALLMIEKAPIASPATVGANSTFRMVLWPALSCADGVLPTKAKPVPLMDTCEMSTAVLPAFVKLMGWVDLPPSATSPKSTVAALTASVPEDEFVPV